MDQTKVEQIIAGSLPIFDKYSNSCLFTYGNIPEKKINNALKNYVTNEHDTILALVDFTFFGSAKKGLAIGTNGMYWKDDSSENEQFIDWKTLDPIVGQITAENNIIILSEYSRIDIGGSSLKPKDLIAFIKEINHLIISVLSDKEITSYDEKELKNLKIRFFIPSSNHSLLFKLQKNGFLLRSKLHIYRDFLIYIILLMGAFYCSSLMDDIYEFGLYMLIIAVLYIGYFLVASGIIHNIIGMIVLLFVLGALSGVFPPLGILLTIIGFFLIIQKVISIIYLLPWAILSVLFYGIIYYAHENLSYGGQLIFEANMEKFLIFSIIVALFATSKYQLLHGLFRLAIMFGTVPLIVLYVLLNKDGGNAFSLDDMTDGTASVDSSGLRIDYPDGSYARWVEGVDVASHWRIYH
ncbi:MAG: hypothetical protein JEZ02_09755 [Desulfatibacillum sp.]|nr:hypothetical protein [Desulfatibacillum sp.]